MTGAAVAMRAATRDDLGWIVALEQSPTNARFLFAWSPQRHAASLATPDKSYLAFETVPEQPCGFAILAGLRSPERAVELVRVAIDPPGQGLGRAALRLVMDYAFDVLGARRLFLDVFDDNPRARRTYRALGFVEEQILPAAARRQDGTLGDLVIMAMAAADRPRME